MTSTDSSNGTRGRLCTISTSAGLFIYRATGDNVRPCNGASGTCRLVAERCNILPLLPLPPHRRQPGEFSHLCHLIAFLCDFAVSRPVVVLDFSLENHCQQQRTERSGKLLDNTAVLYRRGSVPKEYTLGHTNLAPNPHGMQTVIFSPFGSFLLLRLLWLFELLGLQLEPEPPFLILFVALTSSCSSVVAGAAVVLLWCSFCWGSPCL